jgi:hypothetical protein
MNTRHLQAHMVPRQPPGQIYLNGLRGLGQTASELPTDIQSIATSVSQAIQSTTNPNAVAFTGNLAPLGTLPTVGGLSIGALLLIGAAAFFLLKR